MRLLDGVAAPAIEGIVEDEPGFEGDVIVAGALRDGVLPRIVRIGPFNVDVRPHGALVILRNRDVPGVIGRVGTLLGERGINIAGIELGRDRVGGMAISMIHVDQTVPSAVLEELRTLPPIVSAQLLRL